LRAGKPLATSARRDCIKADGSFVAIAWSAATPSGEASVSGEQAPRVALATWTAGPHATSVIRVQQLERSF